MAVALWAISAGHEVVMWTGAIGVPLAAGFVYALGKPSNPWPSVPYM
jgi:hypothetical protein